MIAWRRGDSWSGLLTLERSWDALFRNGGNLLNDAVVSNLAQKSRSGSVRLIVASCDKRERLDRKWRALLRNSATAFVDGWYERVRHCGSDLRYSRAGSVFGHRPGCARFADYSRRKPSHLAWSAGRHSLRQGRGLCPTACFSAALIFVKEIKHALDNFRNTSDSVASWVQSAHRGRVDSPSASSCGGGARH